MGLKAPSVHGKAPKVSGKAPHVKPRARVAGVADELAPLGHTAYRVGFLPRDALGQVAARFDSARTLFALRRQIAAAFPAADPGRVAVREAHEEVGAALDALTDAEVDQALRLLRETVGDVPAAKDKASLLAAVRREFDDEVAPPGPRVSARPPRATAFDQIDSLAAQEGAVLAAQRTFEQACLHADANEIAKAAKRLQEMIKKHGKEGGLDWKQRRRCTRAIDTVVRTFQRNEPTAAGASALRQVFSALAALEPEDAFVTVFRRLQPWLDDADLARIGEALGRMKPAADIDPADAANVARARTNVMKGFLGELFGRKGPYRELFEEQLMRAQAFVDGPSGRGWSVLTARTPIRGLNRREILALFYDDAVLVVDEVRGRVGFVFTAQFKAGDVASLGVFGQLDNDEIRAGLGKLVVDGRSYDIEAIPLEAERAIVTTKLGVLDESVPFDAADWPQMASAADTAAAIGTKDVRFVPMPISAEDLDALAAFLLRAAGKIAAE